MFKTTLKYLALAALCVIASGCETVAYYQQSVTGHLDLLWRAEPISVLIASPETDTEKRALLREIQSIRRFASEELGLPDNHSYTKYVDVERPYLVWNVTAAPEFNVSPKQWCYPIIGCAAYRGYYQKQHAQQKASELKAEGYDTAIGGVPAYSTLGWTDDPVPSTITHWSKPSIAALLFHELAHQQIYFPGDSAFNEAFAVVVANAGVKRWLQHQGKDKQLSAYQAQKRRARQVVDLLLKARNDLRALYDTNQAHSAKRKHKQQRLQKLKLDFQILSKNWPAPKPYLSWFKQNTNNAHLATIATYHDLATDLSSALDECNDDLPQYYQALSGLLDMAPEQRRHYLQSRFLCQ